MRRKAIISPNLAASFVVFVMVGMFTYIFNDQEHSETDLVKASTFFVLLFNAAYYYFYEIYTELDKQMVEAIHNSDKIEWVFRFLGQCVLYCLWFLLDEGFIWFELGLVALYVLYIFFSMITWDNHPQKTLAYVDLTGLFLACVLVVLNVEQLVSPMNKGFFMGLIAAGYFGITIVGIKVTKFNPLVSIGG